jgi:hypothetical protein
MGLKKMMELLRFTITVYDGRPHQSGRSGGSGIVRDSRHRLLRETSENPHGPVVEHVSNGKPLTMRGKKLLQQMGRN